MRKALLATASAAAMCAAGPALAADMLSVGISGAMEQWIGVVGIEKTDDDGRNAAGAALPTNDLGAKDGVMQVSDSEIHFRGSLEADNGLKFSVKVELEGNSTASQIDESQLTVSGEFGQLVMGAEDSASVLTHHGVRSTGAVGINCGDAGAWVDGVDGCSPDGFGTSGHGFGDKNSISYYSPRISGFQFGATYIPNWNQEGSTSKLNDNDTDGAAVGGNYVGEFGGANVAASIGHHVRGQVLAEGSDITKVDELMFTNVGLQVGFGAFSFDIAFGDYESGKYKEDENADGETIMVEDNSGDAETLAAGAMYSEGPLAVSLGFIGTEYGNGTDQAMVELGTGYTLVPGAVWKSSLFMVEKNGSDTDNGAYKTEGTGFVTGIAISF